MKKSTFIAGLLVLAILKLNAQAPKYCMLEEFTQASCGPCGQQNPGFEKGILDKNPSTVRQISYHTSWPGYDPMYNYNTSQSNSRVNYYAVTGVPDVFMMGNQKEAGPGQFTQSDIDGVTSETSPLKIRVTDVDNGSDHTVTVVVESWGTPPTGTNWKLRAAIVERNVNYATAPGTNGEKYFPNVFRKMLPSTTGDPITFAPQGSSVTFTYSYTEDAVWNMDEIGVIAFVQDDNTHAIENCGASFDPDAYMTDPAILTHAGSPGTESSFDVAASNYGTASEDFQFTLTTDAPADWSANFEVDGNTYADSGTATLDINESKTATIHVTPGSTAAVGTYTLTITNMDDPNDDPVSESVYVFNGVTDLIINGSGSQGAGSGETPEDWDANFVTGIQNTGCSTFGTIKSGIAVRANTENSLTGVKYIYYNVGWSFPGITDDEVAFLETFLDNGGSLLICGQDLGWDIWSAASAGAHPSQAKKDFYNNYLSADFIADGDATNSQLTAVSTDPIFGGLANLIIVHHYGSYFYPDQISPIGNGTAIFNYNSLSSKVAGVKTDNGTFKTVYIAPGMEMFSPVNAGYILTPTYNWFHGISGINDPADNVLGAGYPNPADGYTIIPVSNVKGKSTFILFNSIGQIVMKQNLEGGISSIEINTSALPQGMYHYQVTEGQNQTSYSLQVIH